MMAATPAGPTTRAGRVGVVELVFHEVGRDEPVEDSEVAVVASIGQITPVAFELQYSRQIADSQKAA